MPGLPGGGRGDVFLPAGPGPELQLCLCWLPQALSSVPWDGSVVVRTEAAAAVSTLLGANPMCALLRPPCDAQDHSQHHRVTAEPSVSGASTVNPEADTDPGHADLVLYITR